MRRAFALGVGLLALVSCDKTPAASPQRPPPHVDPPAEPKADSGAIEVPEPDEARTALVPKAHPQFSRVEGDGFPNACSGDGDCFRGGCSSEVCSAERGVNSTCDVVDIAGWPPDAACGCLASQCQWFSPSAASLPGAAAGDCDGKTCEAPEQCVRYYGIAGASGPQFASCEVRCKAGAGSCPAGSKCVTIADGPGSVCR